MLGFIQTALTRIQTEGFLPPFFCDMQIKRGEDTNVETVSVCNVSTAEHVVTAQIDGTRLSASVVRTDSDIQIYNDVCGIRCWGFTMV